MNTIKLLAETEDTVTISRLDLQALMDATELAENMASAKQWRGKVAAVGLESVLADALTSDEVERLLDGENRVRFWRGKRRLTQRGLAAAAGVPPGYLSEIETGKKPGSVAALRALAAALNVRLDDLVPD